MHFNTTEQQDYPDKCSSNLIGGSTLLELAQELGLVTPDPFSSHELGGVCARDYTWVLQRFCIYIYIYIYVCVYVCMYICLLPLPLQCETISS